MKIEKTLTLLKPGNFEKRFKIFNRLDDLLKEDLFKEDFTRTVLVQVNPVPESIIRAHYQHISEMPIYEPTIQAFLESKEGIFLRVYNGKNIIERVRRANGYTDPQKAEKGTIRQVFSNDSLERAWEEVRYLNNIIHASSSVEEAVREIELWREYIEWTC